MIPIEPFIRCPRCNYLYWKNRFYCKQCRFKISFSDYLWIDGNLKLEQYTFPVQSNLKYIPSKETLTYVISVFFNGNNAYGHHGEPDGDQLFSVIRRLKERGIPGEYYYIDLCIIDKPLHPKTTKEDIDKILILK